MEKAFNLLDEKWILATDLSGQTMAYSLKDVFARAHEIKQLAGEMATQDVAVLRLLLAIMHCVYTRKPEYKDARENEDKKKARAIWKNLYERGMCDYEELGAYLESYRECFYLIHPERPFYQVASMGRGTEYTASKLLGDLSESSNKLRLFQTKGKREKAELEFAESARWLLFIIGFDDTSAKPSVRGEQMPSPGAGWLGKLGLIYASGGNLFETLMLNFAMYNKGQAHLFWEDGQAPWELDSARNGERTPIEQPQSQQQLLTTQSRRILLIPKDDRVIGFKLLGGDFFPKEEAFCELMTSWTYRKKENDFVPKRHSTSKQFWRGFSSLVKESDEGIAPGIVKWLAELQNDGVIRQRQLLLCAAAIAYGDKDFFANDTWEDELYLSAALLEEKYNFWINDISSILEITSKMVNSLGFLAVEIEQTKSDSKNIGDGARNTAREEAYFQLDMPFRAWLASVDPVNDDKDVKRVKWLDIARDIVLSCGKELVSNAGESALVGRVKDDKIFSAASSYLIFQRSINKIYFPKNKEGIK